MEAMSNLKFEEFCALMPSKATKASEFPYLSILQHYGIHSVLWLEKYEEILGGKRCSSSMPDIKENDYYDRQTLSPSVSERYQTHFDLECPFSSSLKSRDDLINEQADSWDRRNASPKKSRPFLQNNFKNKQSRGSYVTMRFEELSDHEKRLWHIHELRQVSNSTLDFQDCQASVPAMHPIHESELQMKRVSLMARRLH